MRYSIEPTERRYVKGYRFLSFAKNVGRNLSNKYGQKLVDTAKKSATDALKTASKWAIQKTPEVSGDLVGNTQIRLAMKNKKKDIYHHKKDKKLLMN